MHDTDFRDKENKAQNMINETNQLKHTVERFQKVNEQFEDLEVTYELVKEENDQDLLTELNDTLEDFRLEIDDYELELLLNAPYDANNAILELHPGAGGTESQDWASILLRSEERRVGKE